MLLTIGLGDFKQVLFRQAAGVSQNRRGHQRVIVKRKLRVVSRGASSTVDRISSEWARVLGICPVDQANEVRCRTGYLGFTEASSLDREPGPPPASEFWNVPLGRYIPHGTVQFRD